MGGRTPGPALEHVADVTGGRRTGNFTASGPLGTCTAMTPGAIICSTPLLTPEDIESFAAYVTNAALGAGRGLDRSLRVTIEQAVIRVGGIPVGFPRELLHHYIFGRYETLYLSPTDFLKKVRPVADVYDPNKATGGDDYPKALKLDLLTKLVSSSALRPSITFRGRYSIGAFHGAHSTGGLGRMKLMVEAEVTGSSLADWRLEGTAILKAEKWDFNWEPSDLWDELAEGGVSFDRTDLRGRERRTFLGSRIPGRPFFVAMTGPVKIYQLAGDEWATFSL
jgi:hypothetical protein